MNSIFRSFLTMATVLLLFFAAALSARSFFLPSGSDDSGYSFGVGPGIVRLVDHILLLLVVVLSAVVLILVVRVLVQVFIFISGIIGRELLADTSSAGRLAGILTALLLFSGPLIQTIQSSTQIFMSLFYGLISGLLSMTQSGLICISETSYENNSEIKFPHCLINQIGDAIRAISSTVDRLVGGGGISGLDYFNLLFAFGAFVLVSRLFGAIKPQLSTSDKFWFSYACVAVFSVYLCLSALLAVPLLSGEREDPAIAESQLRSMLQGMVPPELKSEADAQVTSQAEGTVSLREAIKKVSNATPQITALLDSIDEDQSRSVQARVRLEVDVKNALQSQLEAAVVSYSVEADIRRGDREARRHVLDLATWFRSIVSSGKDELDRCDLFLSEITSSKSRLIQIVQQSSERTDSRVYNSTLIRDLQDTSSDVRGSADRAEVNCNSDIASFSSPPSRANYGSFLGVVGSAASWLLTTESIQVTLLTGLVGFGLLGSLVAFFVRNPDRAKVANPIDIAILIFTGFCAAIVVYVASYGGLAIASVSSNDPNPYVVFFACLVGAIYSSDIFSKAKDALFNKSDAV